jgi:very-short-patch-repair endonuclease
MPRRFSRTYAEPRKAKHLKQNLSATEARLWSKLRSSRMGVSFRRQHYIGRRFADYTCVPLNLVIEIDGPTHSEMADFNRDRELALRGFDVMHVPVQEMDERFDQVVDRIWAEVQLRVARMKHVGKPGGGG